MINLNFNFSIFHLTEFNGILNKHGMITENCAWEFNIYRSSSILGFELTIRPPDYDHTGVTLSIRLFTIDFELDIYDKRHKDQR